VTHCGFHEIAFAIIRAIIGYARGFFAKFPFFGGLLILPGKDKVL